MTTATGTSFSTTGIAIGYVDNDEYRDLVVSSSASIGSDSVSENFAVVRTGDESDGAISSDPIGVFEMGVGYSPITLVDVDNNGRHDVVLNKIFLLSNATGELGSADRVVTGLPVGAGVWGDIDKDGYVDVAFVSPAMESVYTLRGSQSGIDSDEPTESDYSGPAFHWHAFGDATGSGHADIIGLNVPPMSPAGEAEPGALMLLTGDGEGHFEIDDSRTVSLEERAVRLAGGDFNCDGMMDAAVAIADYRAPESNKVQVYLSAANGWEDAIDF